MHVTWIKIALLTIFIILLHQECYGSFIMDAAEKIYPNSTVREKNLIASLNTLKNMREEAVQLGTNNNLHKKIEGMRLLLSYICTSFYSPPSTRIIYLLFFCLDWCSFYCIMCDFRGAIFQAHGCR